MVLNATLSDYIIRLAMCLILHLMFFITHFLVTAPQKVKKIHITGFYPSTFVYSRFFPKIEFFIVLFAKSVNLDLQIPEKCIFDILFDYKEYVGQC